MKRSTGKMGNSPQKSWQSRAVTEDRKEREQDIFWRIRHIHESVKRRALNFSAAPNSQNPPNDAEFMGELLLTRRQLLETWKRLGTS
jgi:hypothetical protein